MSWKRYFRSVSPNNPGMAAPKSSSDGSAGTSSNYSSYLPEVYAGHPNRIQRYYQYDDMDRDSDINAALDTIADFCTQSEEQSDEPFELAYSGEPNETEVSLLRNSLIKWTKINSFRSRLWHMFRNTIKNGDAFFLRDPETQEWLWIDNFMVEMVKVDDSLGKEPDEYIIRGLDYNRQDKFATAAADPSQYRSPLGSNAGGRPQVNQQQSSASFSLAGASADPRGRNFGNVQNQLSIVKAENIVHLSLSVGMDINWPFGPSILEPIFKVYKQKELLEDSVIIYRVQRAPERRIFYIHTGSMPPVRAKAHLEQIKNEIHQRRIPNRSGGGSGIDASYNPLCLAMDTKIPLLDGRTLTITELMVEYKNGKENWAYSCDPSTGKPVPGKITWAGVTKNSATVIKIILDNDEQLICTPAHQIPVFGKGYVEAQNLTIEDSLIAFNTRHNSMSKDNSSYIQVYNHESKKWEYTHYIIGEFFNASTYLLPSVKNEDALAITGLSVNNKVTDDEYLPENKIKSIEVLDEKIEVGTITIDGKEEFHKHHNFAITAGIFVKNSMLDDFYFAVGDEGKGSKVETLPGGEMTGEIGDLLFFAKKMARGLRIPTSYLALGGDEEGGATYNDGKLGAAMIQEFRFNKYCMRIQSLLSPKFDKEFKQYLRATGIVIDENLFEVKFLPPQNFTKYRQIELDAQQVQVYTQLSENKKLSERFKLKRFLNLSDDELLDNEKLWAEENAAKMKIKTGMTPAEDTSAQDLGSVGVRSAGSDFGMDDMPADQSDDAFTDLPPSNSPPSSPPPAAAAADGGSPLPTP